MDFTEVEKSIATENYSAARDLLLEHLKLVASHRDESAWLKVVDQLRVLSAGACQTAGVTFAAAVMVAKASL